jgi:hypothetical protein
MGAAASDSGFIVRCCEPRPVNHPGSEANSSLIEISESKYTPLRRGLGEPTGTVVRIDDPVDCLKDMLKEADDLKQRCRLADFASRSEPCDARCSQYRLCQDGHCQRRVGHCSISRITDASGCPLAR